VVSQLEAILRELQPAIVITFGPDGIYGHPDHVNVYRLATEAVMRYGATADQGPALYYQATPRERVLETRSRSVHAVAEGTLVAWDVDRAPHRPRDGGQRPQAEDPPAGKPARKPAAG